MSLRTGFKLPGSWTEKALCKGFPRKLWFPRYPRGMTKDTEQDLEAAARSICAMCPVRITCLEFALEDADEGGIWGGTNEKERAKIRKERKVEKLKQKRYNN